MAQEYVEKRNGGYYVMGSRVSLESVIYPFLDGASPETIVEEFPDPVVGTRVRDYHLLPGTSSEDRSISE